MKILKLSLLFLLSQFSLSAQNSALSNELDAYLTDMQQTKALNGVVLVAVKGRPIYKKSFGLADPKTNRILEPNAPFYLGSITKQFTTMGIMLLKEQGKLSYEDPLSSFFTQFPDYAKEITIQQLMNHTSGIKDQYNLGIYKKGLTNKDVFNLLITKGLNFKPGSRWQYSNGGYVLLAMIIEQVSGKDLPSFMQESIFDPLGMKNSYVVHPKTKHPKNRAIGFSIAATEDQAMGNDYEIFTTGAGGIYSTVDDLLKWDQALYTEKLVPKATLQAAYQPTILNDGTKTNYGFGWAIVEKDKVVAHTGSLNGFRNVIERDLENNRTFIALTNNTATYRDDLRIGLRKIIKENIPIAIENATFIDVENGTTKENQTIIIEQGKIKSIKKGKQNLSFDTKIINANGKFIVPGLVDAHIHFFQSGGLYTRPDALDLKKYKPYEEEIQWLKNNASNILQRYLQAGITTVVDVGGPMYNYTIREQFQTDKLAPSIYLTGPLVSTYQPDAFKIEDPPIIKVNNPQEARDLVKQQVPKKPDFIKIWYIARKPQDALDTYPIIEATMQEATQNGLRVAVHATQLYTAKLAVKAGADLLVHSVDDVAVDQEFIELLKKQGTVYCPTLVVSANYSKVFTESYQPTPEDYKYSPPTPLGSLMDIRHLPEPQIKNRYAELKDFFQERNHKRDSVMAYNLAQLLAANIPIATGTDAGNIGTLHVSSYFEELKRMKKAGMNNAQILKASTINGAKAVGKAEEFGSIAVGKRADLLVLNQNPLMDINHLKDIELIINKGTITEKNLVQNIPEQLAQEQLNAYNGHNLEAFLRPYAEDVKVYTFPDKLQYEGKARMREIYQFIEQNPALHCELVNRMVQGNTVIDQESVRVSKDRPPFSAIAIYKIRNGEIAEVYFLQ